MNLTAQDIAGIGMTSQRTRDRMVRRLREAGIADKRVLNAMAKIPRHLFVEEAMSSRAYEDTALPIGHSQTISQPYTVALMTQSLLRDGTPERVLELGTGSGYQSAVLSQVLPQAQIYTQERILGLLQQAKARFRALGYHNIYSEHADGGRGWESRAPFDAIIVTAAMDEIPYELMGQLDIGGRLICPLGEHSSTQELTLFTREEEAFVKETIEAVRFVPVLPGRV